MGHYRDNIPEFKTFASVLRTQILGSPLLRKHIRFVRVRVKDPEHLRDKLYRKLEELLGNGRNFSYSKKNLFTKINDLAGLRIIHLHTQQILPIRDSLRALFDEEKYRVIEGPTARIWDEEYKRFFREAGIATKTGKTLYTSVHYILKPNRKTPITCELQVRTLLERSVERGRSRIELPGQVRHSGVSGGTCGACPCDLELQSANRCNLSYQTRGRPKECPGSLAPAA